MALLWLTIRPHGSKSSQFGTLDTVSIHYVGTLQNGTLFDSSRDRFVVADSVAGSRALTDVAFRNAVFTTEIGTGKVIRGWDEGIELAIAYSNLIVYLITRCTSIIVGTEGNSHRFC